MTPRTALAGVVHGVLRKRPNDLDQVGDLFEYIMHGKPTRWWPKDWPVEWYFDDPTRRR